MIDGAKRCGCDQLHHTFGACIRAKGLRTAVGASHTVNTDWDAHLDRYEWAASQGIQPEGTLREQTEAAIAISNATGVPYRADG